MKLVIVIANKLQNKYFTNFSALILNTVNISGCNPCGKKKMTLLGFSVFKGETEKFGNPWSRQTLAER